MEWLLVLLDRKYIRVELWVHCSVDGLLFSSFDLNIDIEVPLLSTHKFKLFCIVASEGGAWVGQLKILLNHNFPLDSPNGTLRVFFCMESLRQFDTFVEYRLIERLPLDDVII
jgi:hypothetical protein